MEVGKKPPGAVTPAVSLIENEGSVEHDWKKEKIHCTDIGSGVIGIAAFGSAVVCGGNRKYSRDRNENRKQYRR